MITMKNSCLRVSCADMPTDAQACPSARGTAQTHSGGFVRVWEELGWRNPGGEATEGLRRLSLKSGF